MPEPHDNEKQYTFAQKVWIVCGIFAFVVIFLLLFEATFNVIILIFASVLIACYFRGISSFIENKTGWNPAVTLTISIGGTVLIFAGIFWLAGATISNEAERIGDALPAMVEEVKGLLDDSDLGQEGIEKVEEWRDSGKFGSYLSRLFSSTFGYLGDFIIIIVIGIFFTASPNLYLNGIVQLVPPRNRDTAEDVLEKLATGLKKWLAGRFLAMLAVFILTSIGLSILGVPMWFTLALIAGLLNFIPNFGPILASIPAILIALSISPTTAAIVAGLYLVVQLLESGIINPLAQNKLVKIPPALIIISQLFVGAITGIWGIILATPIVLIIIIIVRELYVKPMNERGKTA